MIAASKCFHVFDAASKAGNISLLHPCAALLMYDKLLQSLKIGHDGENCLYLITQGLVMPVCQPAHTAPPDELNQTLTAMHPSPIVPTI